jgi:hypothetical protein
MVEFELEEVRVYLKLAEGKLVVARDLVNLGHSITDAEAFLTKAWEIVAEAAGPESEQHVGEPI